MLVVDARENPNEQGACTTGPWKVVCVDLTRQLLWVQEGAAGSVLLEPGEIRYAEARGNTVWLQTDRGYLRAATRGLLNIERQLSQAGFQRAHRRFVVNLRRVREVERGFNGELLLITDVRGNEIVPVSRGHAKTLRRELGL
jgi:DNA-binding LytR/AlgR family response regulator